MLFNMAHVVTVLMQPSFKTRVHLHEVPLVVGRHACKDAAAPQGSRQQIRVPGFYKPASKESKRMQ